MSRKGSRETYSGHSVTSKSTDSHTSFNVTIPSADADDLEQHSPVQVRSLSPGTHSSQLKRSSGSSSHRLRGQSRSSGTVPPVGTPVHHLSLSQKELDYLLAVKTIERAWLCYRDRQMFKLLKHAICAAEHSLSTEILRKVSPKEAELLKDKCMQSKVRLRFGGTEFPPLIYFKVFTSTSNGMGVKYVSGKKMIQPASEAARDACDRMGHRTFYDQMLQDTVQNEQHKITDEVDVTTLKDYMQYLSFVDETPSYMGGRGNSWRQLTLEVLPRQTIFYDVVEYLYSKKMSHQLAQELPDLLLQPRNEDVQLQHMNIISRLRLSTPTAPSTMPKSHWLLTASQTTGRRSRQAQVRAKKMRHLYEQRQPDSETRETSYAQPPTGKQSTRQTGDILAGRGLYSGQFHEEEDFLDEEAQKLYEWTQELSLEDVAATPRMPTMPTQI